MRIAIIGAGVSGLVAARVLTATGHRVTVFERCSDLGGVWSASRRYPGVTTQDDRVTYSFSDSPMPASYPEHPTGEQVQQYLTAYAEEHGLTGLLRLGTQVTSARLAEDDSAWLLHLQDADGRREQRFDFLVAAHGTYSEPHVPTWPGRGAFEAAGGRVVEPSSLGDGSLLTGRDVVVVGWGKTACDVAVAAADRARATALVARELRWKYPKRIGARLTFHHLLLTRAGEHLIAAPHRTVLGRLLAVLTRMPRKALALRLARSVDAQLGLTRLGLRPRVGFADSNSLVTDGFYEAIQQDRLRVTRDTGVADLGVIDGDPVALLRTGDAVPAQVVVPATGYDQRLDLFAPETLSRLVEPGGDLLLHRKVLPVSLPRLAFVGWSQSYRSPLTAEVHALWLAGLLQGAVFLPSKAAQRRGAARYRLTRARATAAGAPQMPSGSFGELDVLLEDLGLPLPAAVRRRQLLHALDPADYSYVLAHLMARVARPADTQPVPLPDLTGTGSGQQVRSGDDAVGQSAPAASRG